MTTEYRATAPAGTPVLVCLPPGDDAVPCVIVLHERYGLGQHTIDIARRIAAGGYAVIAPDLFASFPDRAGLQDGTAQATPTDASVLAQLEDAVSVFSTIGAADPAHLAVIGVCQTGRYPFLWAAHHPVDACVVFYGAAMERDWDVNARQPWGMDGLIERIDAPVLGIFGEGDHIISIDNVLRLRAALERADTSYQLSVYAAAPHGWLNDTMPGRYRPDAAEAAWSELTAFIDERLRRKSDAGTIRWSFSMRKHRDYDFGKNVRFD